MKTNSLPFSKLQKVNFCLSLLAFLFMGLSIKAQTMPTPQSLPYTQDFSSLTGGTNGTIITYPAGWQGWVVGTARPTNSAPVTAPSANKDLKVGDATVSGSGCYDYLGKMGFVSTNIISGDIALCLSVNTTGKNNIKVSFDAMTVRCLWNGTTENRKNGLVLQYRVGTSGNFTAVPYLPSEYNTGETANTTGTTAVNIVTGLYAILPGACDNQPVVQIRWQYRLMDPSSGAAGSRPGAAIDNVSVNEDETLSNNADLLSLTIDAKADGNFVQPMLFNKNTLQYTYYLTKNNPLPVIAADPESGVATKVITQATSLNGTQQQRTATVEITAEDGTTIKTYSVQFIQTDNVFQSGLYTASLSNAPTGWSRVEMYFASSLTDGNNKYEGANYARCNSAVTASSLTLPPTKSVETLKFYARKIDPNVVGNIKVSTKIDEGAWTVIQDLGDISNSTYQEFSVPINQIAVDEMLVRIEITKNGDTYPSQGYYLDDISYTSSTTVYVWNQTGTASWTTAGNWTPTRTTPAITDVLQISGAGSLIVTDVPSQTIRQLLIKNNTNVELQNVNAASLTITEDVTIKQGALLHLNPASTGTIIVSGNIIAEKGGMLTNAANSTLNAVNLILQSNSTGTGTFINNGSLALSGTATAQQYLGAIRNWYMSSPVSGATAMPTISSGSLIFYAYPEDHANQLISGTNPFVWSPGNYWTTPVETSFTDVKGYIVRPSEVSTLSFSGTSFNSGQKTIGLTYSSSNPKKGFNLVGNPYPAYINILKPFDTDNDGDIDLNDTDNNIMPTYWIKTQTPANAYIWDTYNLPSEIVANGSTLPLTKFISPMQAFWMRAKTNSGATLILNSSMSSHQDVTNNKFRARSSSNMNNHIVRLKVSNGINSDETVLYVNENASNEFDNYDSPKMSNGNASIPEIYTTSSTEKLVINGMKTMSLDTPIGLGFIPGSASLFSIKANEISNLPEGVKVILNDNGVEFDLTNGAEYSFNSDVANNTNRFSLLFRSPGISTDLENNNTTNQAQVFVDANNQLSIIAKTNSKFTIYNAVGQQIAAGKITSNSQTSNFKLMNGVYVVKVGDVTKKVIIK